MTRAPDPQSAASSRSFTLFWSAQSTSLVGLQVGMVAIPLLAIDVLGADVAQVALIGTLSALPWLIAPLVGSLVSRVRRKPLLVVSHLTRALLWLTIPSAHLLGVLTVQQLWLVASLVGVLSVAFGIGHRTILPTLVPKADLGPANGKLAATDAVARAVGPAVAGGLVQGLGAVWTTAGQAVTGLVAGTLTARIRTDQPPAPPSDDAQPPVMPWWPSVTAGFACLYRLKSLRWLTLAETTYTFCFAQCFAILVVFFRTTLELSATTIGVIFSAGSVGGIVGASMANRLRTRFGFDRSVKSATVLRGLGLAVLPLSLVVPDSTVLVVLILGRGVNAAAWSVYGVLHDTYHQEMLSDDNRASGTAAALWLVQGAATIGAGAATALAGAVGVTTLLACSGGGAIVAGFITFAVRTAASSQQSQPPEEASS